jgi:hypothetical protein
MLYWLDGFCKWLQSTGLSLAISDHFWAIPLLQTIHILAIALVISSVFLVNLRLAGLTGGDQPVDDVARRFLPFIWWPLPVLLITGALLISAEPARSLENPSFAIKMSLLLTAIVLTIFFHRTLIIRPGYWQATSRHRFAARLLALAAIAVWTGIVLAGRWIAYTQP